MVGGENFSEAGAKVRLISEPAKFFSKKNKKNNKNDDLRQRKGQKPTPRKRKLGILPAKPRLGIQF